MADITKTRGQHVMDGESRNCSLLDTGPDSKFDRVANYHPALFNLLVNSQVRIHCQGLAGRLLVVVELGIVIVIHSTRAGAVVASASAYQARVGCPGLVVELLTRDHAVHEHAVKGHGYGGTRPNLKKRQGNGVIGIGIQGGGYLHTGIGNRSSGPIQKYRARKGYMGV